MAYRDIDKFSDGLLYAKEQKLLRAYAVALKDIRGQLAVLHDKYAIDGVLSYADLTKYGRMTNIKKQLATTMNSIDGKTRRITAGAIKEQFKENFYRTAFEVEQQVGAGLRFGLLNEDTVTAALDNPMDLIKWGARARDQTALLTKQLQTTIVQAVIQGKGYAATSKLVKDRLEIGAVKTMRILRTEGHRAQIEGRLGAMDKAAVAAAELGLEVQRLWVANLDARVRPSHGAMDGKIARTTKKDYISKFRIAGTRARGPGLTGIAGEDINCRCTVRTQLKGYPPEMRYIKGEGIVPYETYDQWTKRKGIPKPPKPRRRLKNRS